MKNDLFFRVTYFLLALVCGYGEYRIWREDTITGRMFVLGVAVYLLWQAMKPEKTDANAQGR